MLAEFLIFLYFIYVYINTHQYYIKKLNGKKIHLSFETRIIDVLIGKPNPFRLTMSSNNHSPLLLYSLISLSLVALGIVSIYQNSTLLQILAFFGSVALFIATWTHFRSNQHDLIASVEEFGYVGILNNKTDGHFIFEKEQLKFKIKRFFFIFCDLIIENNEENLNLQRYSFKIYLLRIISSIILSIFGILILIQVISFIATESIFLFKNIILTKNLPKLIDWAIFLISFISKNISIFASQSWINTVYYKLEDEEGVTRYLSFTYKREGMSILTPYADLNMFRVSKCFEQKSKISTFGWLLILNLIIIYLSTINFTIQSMIKKLFFSSCIIALCVYAFKKLLYPAILYRLHNKCVADVKGDIFVFDHDPELKGLELQVYSNLGFYNLKINNHPDSKFFTIKMANSVSTVTIRILKFIYFSIIGSIYIVFTVGAALFMNNLINPFNIRNSSHEFISRFKEEMMEKGEMMENLKD